MDSFSIGQVRERISANLTSFLATQEPKLAAIHPEAQALLTELRTASTGGKLARGTLLFLGYQANGPIDQTDPPSLLDACAAMELLQACALIHDDIIDVSDSRRGQPATHRRFESRHRDRNLRGSASHHGVASAILLGDLALVWADELLQRNQSWEQFARTKPIYDQLRTELIVGQYLDVVAQDLPQSDLEFALTIANFKSGKYSVERPLQLGVQLAGDNPALTQFMAAFGAPLGQAFQLRDDLLGVFGDPAVTGKPAGDDLREGKRTALIAIAESSASDRQRHLLTRELGNPELSPESVQALQQLLIDTGAKSAVEELIDQLSATSRTCLADAELPEAVRTALADYVSRLTVRDH